jgi:predicted CXXCH cytochrome family protein
MDMKRFGRCAVLFTLGGIVLLASALAGPPGALAEPQGPDKCLSASCHANYGKAKFVHGPVGAGVCTPCHRPHKDYTPEKHNASNFTMAAKGKDLCFICHENLKKVMTGKFVHGPVAMGDCIACHDPHQSDSKFSMKKPTTSALCFSCHENKMTIKPFLHGPVAAGDCNVCHNPHAADNKYQLMATGNDLCFLCHEDRRAEFTRKSVHKPVTESCAKCHDSHNADFKYLLSKDQVPLCLECHVKMDEHLKKVKGQHSALKKGPCTTCHTPHSSNFVRQLKKSTKEICYDCHKDIGGRVQASKSLHGPVQQDDCYACHDSHGSDFTQILKKFFPPEFYTEYKTENYNICWDCHNKDVAVSEVTTTLTGFRNGGRNLHFVHVNKKKGRSCKACHEAHAGNQDKHIRPDVPFGGGGWKLPIQYTRNATGGNCVVGCHRELSYDREAPVKY